MPRTWLTISSELILKGPVVVDPFRCVGPRSCCSKPFVTCVTNPDTVRISGGECDWRYAGLTQQNVNRWVSGPVITDLGEKSASGSGSVLGRRPSQAPLTKLSENPRTKLGNGTFQRRKRTHRRMSGLQTLEGSMVNVDVLRVDLVK
jgi:hypothetical protein